VIRTASIRSDGTRVTANVCQRSALERRFFVFRDDCFEASRFAAEHDAPMRRAVMTNPSGLAAELQRK
jgi:hypothetical protein